MGGDNDHFLFVTPCLAFGCVNTTELNRADWPTYVVLRGLSSEHGSYIWRSPLLMELKCFGSSCFLWPLARFVAPPLARHAELS